MGVLRAVEAVADVEEELARDVRLEREGGVEGTCIVAHVEHIEAEAYAYGEDRG